MRMAFPFLASIPALGAMFLVRYLRLRKGLDGRAKRTWCRRAATFLAGSGVALEFLAVMKGTLALPLPLAVLLACAGAFALSRCIPAGRP